MTAVTLMQKRMPRLRYFFARIALSLLLSVFSIAIFAQEPNQKLNMVFKGFITSGSQVHSGYNDILNERMRAELVALQKFNIIERDKEMWKRIEEELKMQDFIDAKTAVNLGNMLGAKYYIEGKLATLKTDRKEEKNSDGKVTSVSYTTTADASLNLINLETGKYEIAVYSTKVSTSSVRQSAIEDAIKAVVADLTYRLGKKFLLEAQIESVNGPDAIVINKGLFDGVKQQHTYQIPSDPGVKFKIIDAGERTATGKLMEGDINKLTKGLTVREAEVESKNVINIKRKEGKAIYLDAGRNLGIKKGDTYVSRNDRAIDLGSRVIYEKNVTGALYITEVNEDYAKAKIIRGYRNIGEGMVVYQPEEEVSPRITSVSAGYKIGFIKPIEANSDHGDVDVRNSRGSFNIDTDYNRRFKDLETVSVYSIGLSSQNLVKDITTTLNADIYDIGGGKLTNWIANLEVTYNHTFSPERLYGIAGAAAGYGRLKQEIPDNTVEEISDDNSSYLKSHSVFGSAVVGLQLRIKKFSFLATASYDYLKFNKWKYDVKNSKDEEKTETAPKDIVPYPTVDLSGVYFKGTLRYQIF